MIDRIGKALVQAAAAFLIGGLTACVLLNWIVRNMQDGQAGMAAAFGGFYVACLVAVVTFIVSIVRSRNCRRGPEQQGSQPEVRMKLIFAGLLLVAASSLSFGQSQTSWDGFVTDTHCGTNCQRTSAMTPDKACVRRFVKQGSKYGLWYGKSVYVLEPQSKAAKFAAENVRVTGSMIDGTIHIASITHIAGQTTSHHPGL
jgi:hypothetical protein